MKYTTEFGERKEYVVSICSTDRSECMYEDIKMWFDVLTTDFYDSDIILSNEAILAAAVELAKIDQLD